MHRQNIVSALVAGALSSAIFLLVASAGLGFFFLFLPTLPILYLALSGRLSAGLAAGFIAACLIGGLGGIPIALVYLLFLALPSCLIARESLWWRFTPDHKAHEFYPIGLIILHLTLYGCSIMALVTGYYTLEGQSIVTLLSQQIHEAFADLEDQYGDVISMLADQWSFLIFAITVWLWGLALYAHLWIANRLLIKKNRHLRADMAVRVFALPNWLLWLLMICGLASLFGSEPLQFLGNAALITLMLPYFFLGLALLHAASKTWLSRRFFLFFIYLFIFAQFWPALLLSGVGLFYHMKHYNKHLSADGSSSSN